MAVEIEDITPDFFAFWTAAEGLPRGEQERLWSALYEEPHREVFDVYYKRWGSPEQLGAALDRFGEEIPAIRTAVPELRRSIALLPRLAGLFRVGEGDLRYVLMVGLFSSNGWATRIGGEPACFCAAETLAGGRGDEVLVAHEAAHGYHGLLQSYAMQDTTHVGESLFLEGFATLCSELALPGLAEAEYLWFGRAHTTRGQDVGEWIAECGAVWPWLREGLLRDLDRDDEPASAAYFWANERLLREGVPVRAGYFVGYRLLAMLSREYAMDEMARWSAERAVGEVRRALEGMAAP